MPQPRVYKTEAVILKGINFGEADRLLSLYTPHLGKIRAIAKGVRRPRSRIGGNVEVLNHSLLLLARGRNLDIITQGQTINSFLPLREDLWRVSRAIYAAELVERFIPEHGESYPVFKLLLNTLGWLCQTKEGELVIRHFEFQLLGHLGYRPELRRCLRCHLALEPTTNFFSPSEGGMLCPHCAPPGSSCYAISPNTLKVMRLLQDSDMAILRRLKINSEVAREMTTVMTEYINYLLEREVKSAVWLERLKGEMRV